MPTNARKTSWYSTGGPWGTGLLLVGVAVLAQGVAYIDTDRHELRTALAWIDHFIPISGWGVLWVLAGLWSIWKGLTPPQRHIEMAPPVGVVCLWAGFYGMHWIIQGITEGVWSRDWMAAVAWGSLAAVLIEFGRCTNPPHER